VNKRMREQLLSAFHPLHRLNEGGVTMTKDEMLNKLYNDYQATKDGWGYQIENLGVTLRTSKAAQLNLDRARAELAALESDVVLGETYPKGRINGTNAETRRHQTDLLLAEFRHQDPSAKSLVNDIELAHQSLNSSSIAIQTIKAQFDRYQATAKMISGLATALGGQL